MFCDQAIIKVSAGKGGDGMVHFRREKFIARGGPDGGDGGRGGSVILKVDPNLNTLVFFRGRNHFKANSGENGARANRHGKSAEDLIVSVPIGTEVFDADTGEFLIDLAENDASYVVVRGGRGGFGNAHFATSTRQAPDFAEKGEPSDEKTLCFELKLVADVGIIGLPSVGKSTLISRISHAKPKIADYPFTTLIPNLGVVDLVEFDSKEKGKSFVIADVPGLIEGASEGKGLGDDFLRHISRTRLLVHVLDAGSNTPVKDFQIICNELVAYDKALAKEEQVVVMNKIDLIDNEMSEFLKAELSKAYPKLKGRILTISAMTGKGIHELVFALWKRLSLLKRKKVALKLKKREPVKVFRPHLDDEYYFEVKFQNKGKIPSDEEPGKMKTVQVFEVTGKRIEQIVKMTDFENDSGVSRVYDVFDKMGITAELEKNGAALGDMVRVAGRALKFLGK